MMHVAFENVCAQWHALFPLLLVICDIIEPIGRANVSIAKAAVRVHKALTLPCLEHSCKLDCETVVFANSGIDESDGSAVQMYSTIIWFAWAANREIPLILLSI